MKSIKNTFLSPPANSDVNDKRMTTRRGDARRRLQNTVLDLVDDVTRRQEEALRTFTAAHAASEGRVLAPLPTNSERQLATMQEERREARAELDRAHDALDIAVDEREDLRQRVRQVIYPFFTNPIPASPAMDAFEEYHERGRFRRRNTVAGKENQPNTSVSESKEDGSPERETKDDNERRTVRGLRA